MSTTDIANMCENLTLADVDDDEHSMQLPNETMVVIWQPMFGVTMKQLQPHRFLVRFYHEADIDRVLADGPWTFEQCLLVMQRLQPGGDPDLPALNHAEFWVQIHSLPNGFRSEMVVSAIGSFLGTLIHTDEKNWDGSIRLFYRVRVAIDITKSLKKQMKLKRDNGMWAFIDFRYERLPTFCFLCGIIRHGNRLCPKFVNGYDRNLEKPFGAWMRAGFRRTTPTSGQRWVAPKTDVEREKWKSPATEAVERGAASEIVDKGKGAATGPHSDAQHAAIPTVEITVQKRRRSDEGPSVQGSEATVMDSEDTASKNASLVCPYSDHLPLILTPENLNRQTPRKRFCFDNMWLREDKCREIVTQSWDRTRGLELIRRIECCGDDIWRWGRTYNKEFQRNIDNCKRQMEYLRGRRDPDSFIEYSRVEKELLKIFS
nr:uncharacterized protein LOC109174453 [Ipomoea batatas]